MSYYRVLGLDREPFSTSPDPAFFYESKHHKAALAKLMIELRLRRGLSVVIGDVGTGKTTLGRKLIQAKLMAVRWAVEPKVGHSTHDHCYGPPLLRSQRVLEMTLVLKDVLEPESDVVIMVPETTRARHNLWGIPDGACPHSVLELWRGAKLLVERCQSVDEHGRIAYRIS